MNCMDGGCGRVSHQPVLEPWTDDERDAEITRLYGFGYTDPEIAELVECGRTTVRRARERLGLATKHRQL